ncbi:hypothetical protein J7382_02715 [Shimia sp. R11_0]|uniref:hypothetical protein n=1 Tax=Shimia sp. R11_0 TaxID=2821096 RepID=UPI001ADBCA6A|nr:hypothetical protein [Shimia sp. R11_0]MBO9476437.1 hypothetical protein [Shimia sp. R11_0]
MIGLVALFLPLFLGVALAFAMCGKAQKASRKALKNKSFFLLVALRQLGLGAIVVVAAGIVLALCFASLTDTLDGHADAPQFWRYARFQMMMISVFFVPALVLALALGRQKRFGEDDI